jgi:hypothetical protein
MTKIEINDIFDIPISTLNEWKKPSSKKHKLYSFLIKYDKQYIDKVTNTHQTHRLFHILNRNIDKTQQYSYDEIQSAFLKEDYNAATQREQLIFSKFFKECDSEDLDSLSSSFEVSKRNIKKIYSSSPQRKLKGVSRVWDKRFRLKHFDTNISDISQSTPSALQLILNRRVSASV